MWDFEIKRVSCAVLPVDHEVWMRSRSGIQNEIWKTETQMRRHYDPDALDELGARVAKLNAIINDLNKVLNA